ncbi:MAG: cadherin-like beta sandwich domain-containing protein, partial [bacterium]|nr:cadherin-like beta sandwich domain-containing protein [bacterium]
MLPDNVVLTPGDGSFTFTWGDWDDQTVIGISRLAWRVKDTDTTMAGDQPGSWISEGINNQRRFATSDEIAAKSLTIVSSQLTNDVTYEVEADFSWQFHGTTTGVLKIGEVTPSASGGSTPADPTALTLTTDAASNTVAEGGGPVTVTATLDEAATAAVSVTLSAGAASTAAATDYTLPAAFTIAKGDTSATGAVQITDDDVDEDNETVVLTATAGSLTVTGVTLTITDDDTRGVTVSQSARTVAAGATTTYTVVLDSQPTASVTITPTSGTVAAATVSGALTFTTSNWSTPQPVTVTGVAAGTATITHAVTTSTDPKYPTTLSIASVAVTVNPAAALSDDASLSGLTGELSTNGTDFSGSLVLVPDFDAETTSYTASVANGVTHIRLTPTTSDSGASVDVGLGSFTETVASGSASSALALSVGSNTVGVAVTAADGTMGTYLLRVTRRVAVPAAPTGLMVVEEDETLELSWTAPGGTVTGYDVHYTSALSPAPARSPTTRRCRRTTRPRPRPAGWRSPTAARLPREIFFLFPTALSTGCGCGRRTAAAAVLGCSGRGRRRYLW